jgi:hypothetical protein
MRKLLCLSSFILTILAYPAPAADLPRKALDVPTVPVVLTNPFYIGIWGGGGFSTQENDLTLGGQTQGPVKAYPTGALAGAVLGYGTSAGNFYYGFSIEAAYDFSRGDVGFSGFTGPGCGNAPNCAGPLGSLKNGLLLQVGGELGISLTTLGGYLPTSAQPSNWPVPITLPASVWSNLIIAGRGGFAGRDVTMCALTGVDPFTGLPDGSQTCGSQFKIGPYVGAEIKAMLSAQTEVFLKYDHVFWNSSFTPASAAPAFVNDTAMAKKEDIFKAGFGYHF